MQINGPDAKEQERRRLKRRVVELEALLEDLWSCWEPDPRMKDDVKRIEQILEKREDSEDRPSGTV